MRRDWRLAVDSLSQPRAAAPDENKVNFSITFRARSAEQSYVPWVLQMWRNAPVLPSMGHFMSPILPISFLATLLCVLVAIDWALYQQILFVGAALSATVWVCALEAWSCQESPVRSADERQSHSAGE
jgi:hypothetical protein